MTYQQLMELAVEALLPVNTVPDSLPAPLAYVLETAKGNTYTVINDNYQEVFDTMGKAKDAVVIRMIALWKGNVVDLPSYAFRKALLEMDAANAGAKLLFLTEGGYGEKPLKATM